MAVMPFDRCARCGLTFGRAAKPGWAFRLATGDFVGRVHASTQGRCRPDADLVAFSHHYDLEGARQAFFLWHVEPRGQTETPDHFAWLLAFEPDRVAERLEWWRRGPLRQTDAQQREILTALAGLEERYRVWKAGRAA